MKNYIYQALIVTLAIVAFFSIQQCGYNKSQNYSVTKSLADTLLYFTNVVGSQTASVATLQADKNTLSNLVLLKDAELAKLSKEFTALKSITKYSTVTKFDTIIIAYNDSIACNFERSGIVNKPWYSFAYHSNQNALKIGALTVPNTATVITGTKRKWFLGKETLTTDITNSNPYIKVTEIKAAQVTITVPWHKKWYIWLAVGAAGGAFMAN